MDSFQHDTYIVLDLPKKVAEDIMRIRIQNKDEIRSALPAEITVIGSSGVGVLKRDQDPQNVYKIIDDIAKDTAPLHLKFNEVERFTGTDIFVMKLDDETEIRRLHECFKNSAMKCKESQFPYTPHCTLRSRSPITDEEVETIMKTRIEDEFVVDTLSVYTMDKLPMTKLYSVKLTGG